MTKVTHELHDRCIAAREVLKSRSPELAAEVASRGSMVIGSPVHRLWSDLDALDRVATCFATGDRAKKGWLARAQALLASMEG